MQREELIGEKLATELLEKPYTYTEMIRVLKESRKKGSEVTQYLPSSFVGMMEKLELLMGELSAGNTAVLPQMVALLGRLRLKGEISYKDYNGFANNWYMSALQIMIVDNCVACISPEELYWIVWKK